MPKIDPFASGSTNRSMPAATVIPVLHYPNVLVAATWLCQAFGFTERLRIGTHRIQLIVGEGAIVIAQSAETRPDDFGHSILVRVRDVNWHFEISKSAGAQIISEPCSQPYGERQYTAKDFAGHVWTFSQSEKDTEPASWGGEMVREGKQA